jgi:hypothetical protein
LIVINYPKPTSGVNALTLTVRKEKGEDEYPLGSLP